MGQLPQLYSNLDSLFAEIYSFLTQVVLLDKQLSYLFFLREELMNVRSLLPSGWNIGKVNIGPQMSTYRHWHRYSGDH